MSRLVIRSLKLHWVSLFLLISIGGCWDDTVSGDTLPFDITAIAVDPVNRIEILGDSIGNDDSVCNTGEICEIVIYLGTDGDGVYKSTDGGNTWRRVTFGLFNLRVRALAVDLFSPDTIYAGMENGIYRSFNGGAVWDLIQGSGTGITEIVIDRYSCITKGLRCNTLYASSESEGVYKSTDAGDTWGLINAGLTETAVKSLAISPPLYLPGQCLIDLLPEPCSDTDIRDLDPIHGSPSEVYAGTEEGHVFRFDNIQQIWIEDPPSLSDITVQEVVSVKVDPVFIPEVPYAGLGVEGGGSFNLYRRIGGIWNFIDVPTTVRGTVHVINFAFSPDENNNDLLTTYVGIGTLAKSNKEGEWIPIDSGLDKTVLSLAIDPIEPTQMFAGSFNSRFFKTVDGGQTWNFMEISF